MTSTPRTGLADLASSYDLVLCDVWGVIHNGVAHHAAAVEALRRTRQGGGRVVLVTNAPAPAAQVQRRLDGLAVPRDAYDAIATSGDVTIAAIVAAGCPPLFSIGPGGEYAIYKEAARLGPRAPEIVGIAAAELAICIGPDATGEQPAAYDASLTALRARDLEMICANPDLVVEMGDTLVTCAGAIAQRYEAIGGRVTQAGKPFPAIYKRALRLAGEAARGGNAARAGDRRRHPYRHRRRGADGVRFGADHLRHPPRKGCMSARRGSAIDEAGLRQFLDESAVKPTYVMPELAWV